MHGPGAVGQAAGHGLPDGVDAVELGAELDGPAEEAGGEVGLGHAGAEERLDVEHRLLVDLLSPADAGQLVRGLAELGRAEHAGSRHRPEPVEERPAERVGHLVAAERGAARDQVPDHGGQGGRPVVEVGQRRGVDVVGGQVGRGALRPRREQVGMVGAGDDQRRLAEQRRPGAVAPGGGGAGGVGDGAGAEQEKAVDPLAGELALEPGVAFDGHARPVRLRRHLPSVDRHDPPTGAK